jgi:hypothetical protein
MKPLKIIKHALLFMFLVAISACLEDEAIPPDDFLQPTASAQKTSNVSALNEPTQTVLFKSNFLSAPTDIPMVIFNEEGFLNIDFTAYGKSSPYSFTQVDLNSKLFVTGKPPWRNTGTFYLIDKNGDKLAASFTGLFNYPPNGTMASSGEFVIKPEKGKYGKLEGKGTLEFIIIPNPYSAEGFETIEVKISGVFTISSPGYFSDK